MGLLAILVVSAVVAILIQAYSTELTAFVKKLFERKDK